MPVDRRADLLAESSRYNVGSERWEETEIKLAKHRFAYSEVNIDCDIPSCEEKEHRPSTLGWSKFEI